MITSTTGGEGMSQSYISEPDKWKMYHIPFTVYFLAKDPETGLWNVVEKELNTTSFWEEAKVPYRYRFL